MIPVVRQSKSKYSLLKAKQKKILKDHPSVSTDHHQSSAPSPLVIPTCPTVLRWHRQLQRSGENLLWQKSFSKHKKVRARIPIAKKNGRLFVLLPVCCNSRNEYTYNLQSDIGQCNICCNLDNRSCSLL
mmetsp:Transcript_2117/g.3256  ORF Transcript_2117/g.3256 Transcript_2117/m.3256 type:complete len:129 (-) Transcript_2117:2222-2608(-)